MDDRVQVVGAALLREDPRTGRTVVLAGRRTAPVALAGRWEFPGGKVDDGESDQAALRRELREELGVEVAVGARFGPDVDIGGTAVLRLYLAQLVSGEPAPLDHAELRWLTAEQLRDVPWIDVDRPLVALLRRQLLRSPTTR